ncbi:MAG: hypothetical protein J1E29_04325 [Duncaniella sp.]|nr:hypothetical protein [Duncaniella sp.]
MNTTTRISSLILMGAVAIAASAKDTVSHQALDSAMTDHHIIYFGDADKGLPTDEQQRELIERFYVNQFENTLRPDAPYFLFMSRDANLVMGIGGNVKLRAYFDPGNSQKGASFSPYDIPIGNNTLNNNYLGTSPAGSALYFRVIGHSRIGSYQVYIKAKFDGGSSGKEFKLNKAYASLNDWTLGYDTSTFSDGSAAPPTVDNNGASMSMDYTTMLVRYLHTFPKSGISIAASLEAPGLTTKADLLSDGSPASAARSQSVPDVAAMVQYQWAAGQHVRLSGIVRRLPYRNLVDNTSHSPIGYGVQLSAVYAPVAPLTLYGTFNIGRSYTNNSGDFLLGDYDLAGVEGAAGRMSTVPSWSYLAGASYYFSPRLFSSVSFGQARVTDSGLSDHYKYGLYGAANVFYNLTSRIQFGAEYLFGRRADYTGSHARANRISLMAQFTF